MTEYINVTHLGEKREVIVNGNGRFRETEITQIPLDIIIDWLKESKITEYSIDYYCNEFPMEMVVSFEREEDKLLFDLTWK